jgi:hypothetical protein
VSADAPAHPQPVFNYEEAKAGGDILPDPLKLNNGREVTSRQQWNRLRRPELLHAFANEMFGVNPAAAVTIHAGRKQIDTHAIGGSATRIQVTLSVEGRGMVRDMHLLIYLPTAVPGRVPVFLGLNFSGNHTISADPGIDMNRVWAHPEGVWLGVTTPLDHVIPPESERGQAASQWQLEQILAHGYGLATVYDGDIEPDSRVGISEGVRPLFYRKGQVEPAANQWGAIGAWAWGLSRVADYLQTLPGVDASKIILFGHSRLGKTALWAAAQDQRFAMVIANESGKGGAALVKRNFGQTVADLNTAFPHWFCGNYKSYSGHEDQLTIDSHELIALIAPRPVYIGGAVDDRGGDPRGQFLAEVNATPVYQLFGEQGLALDEMPGPDEAIHHRLAFHYRSGKHGVTAYDWSQYLRFADDFFKSPVPVAPGKSGS